MKRESIVLIVFLTTLALCGCKSLIAKRGFRYYQRGWYGRSIDTFTYYLTHTDESEENRAMRAGSFFYRGLCKTELGWSEGAIEDYKEAYLREPDFFFASFNLGVEYVRKGEYKVALPYLRAAWKSVLKAEQGELEDSLLWNRRTYSTDKEYAFYYYGMVLVVCGERNEFNALMDKAKSFSCTKNSPAEMQSLFRKMRLGDISFTAGQELVEQRLVRLIRRKCNSAR